MWQFLDSYWPWPLVFTVLLVLVVVLFLRWVFRSALRQEDDLEIEELPGEVTTFDFTRSRQLSASFRWALKQIGRHGGGGARARYRVPWFLLFGQEGSRPNGLMARTGLPPAFDVQGDSGLAEASGLGWSFFDHGVVLDLDGQYLLQADGQSSDSRGWKNFVDQLRWHRPERPLEGLVLTLSCADLLRGSVGVEQKTTQLAMRLRELSSELAINVPVYVLVTGCEQLPEFDSLMRAKKHGFSEIFGWSSPYRADAAYRNGWVDEAYTQIGRDLQLAQIEILGDATLDQSLADDIALLPVALDATRETLRAYLNGLFRSSAFQRGLIVRGIYFSGTAPAPEAAEAQRTFYLDDLLDTKIFPEFGLAQIDTSAWIERSRFARFYQVATVAAVLILGVGMWLAYSSLSARSYELKSFFRQVESDLVQAEFRVGDEAVRQRAQHLLDGMARLDFSRFGSWILPSSWPFVDDVLAGLNTKLEKALALSNGEIIFTAMFDELNERAELYSSVKPILLNQGALGLQAPVPALTSLPSFRTWAHRLEELAQLQEQVERFERLDSHRRRPGEEVVDVYGAADLESFGELVDYLFGFEPPPSFYDDSALYEQALHRVALQSFRVETYRGPTSDLVTQLATEFNRELFQENRLILALADLEEGLANTARSLSSRPEENVSRWRLLLERLDEVEFVLTQPQILWAFDTEPSLGPEYEDLLLQMGESSFLVPSLAKEIAGDVEGAWQWHRERLLSFESRYTGPFLARDGQVLLPRLSGQARQMRDALRMLLDESFMSEDSQHWFGLSIPVGERLQWDVARLEQANGLMAPYEAFKSASLDLFPPDLQPEISRIVRSQTAARMIDLTGEAQSFVGYKEPTTVQETERLLRFEVASLSGAGTALNRLLGDLQNLDAFEAYWDLSALLVLQGSRVLERLENLRDRQRFYQPQGGDFGWWQGETPVAHAAFGVRDQPSLVTYLNRQRARIDQLAAQYAGPTITAVGASRGEEMPKYQELVSQWRAIIEQLSAYQNQTPGNSVAVLENLIAFEMAPIGPDDCRSSQLAVSSVDDFFLQRANVLGRELLQRCEDLAGERAAQRYGEIEALFLQRLSGRFPFAELGVSSPSPSAKPGDLRSFFRLYDAYAESILAVPASNSSFENTGPAAHAFLRRMAEVRTFFGFFLATPEPQAVPRYDFDVIFRVDRESEQAGNQIIDWRLDVGEQSLLAPNGTGRWTYDADEVDLELRWAQDSPRVPFLAVPASHIKVQDRTVGYHYSDPWSLLRFLLEHRGPSPEPNPQTLTFEIETTPSETTADQASVAPEDSISPTVVALRLRLRTPDAQNPQPVTLPSCFPVFAPVLGVMPTTDGCVAQEEAAPMEAGLLDSPASDGSASDQAGADDAASGDGGEAADSKVEEPAADEASGESA